MYLLNRVCRLDLSNVKSCHSFVDLHASMLHIFLGGPSAWWLRVQVQLTSSPVPALCLLRERHQAWCSRRTLATRPSPALFPAAMELQGSCRCGAVRFSCRSHTPVPYQRCYCTICRKLGGSGFSINLCAQADSLKVRAIRCGDGGRQRRQRRRADECCCFPCTADVTQA